MRNFIRCDRAATRKALTAAVSLCVLLVGAMSTGAQRTQPRGRLLGTLEMEAIFGDAPCTACVNMATKCDSALVVGASDCGYCMDDTNARPSCCAASDNAGMMETCTWTDVNPCMVDNTFQQGDINGAPGSCGSCGSNDFEPMGTCKDLTQATGTGGPGNVGMCNGCE